MSLREGLIRQVELVLKHIDAVHREENENDRQEVTRKILIKIKLRFNIFNLLEKKFLSTKNKHFIIYTCHNLKDLRCKNLQNY